LIGLLILFVTGVSFWLYTTRVTTNRSFVALYNVNLGVLFNLFFHAFANLFTANITLCVLLRPQQEKKKEENHPKMNTPFFRASAIALFCHCFY